MNSILKASISFSLIIMIVGCGDFGETPEEPWMGFTTNKKNEKPQWWYSTYQSYDACMEAMNWGITNTESKDYYKEPVGCGYYSNNKIKTIFINIFIADMKYFECIIESKNPEMRRRKMKYGPLLKGYDNPCVSDSRQRVVFSNPVKY
ncbi:hypothetical protein [Zobellella denitrificans]|uniref:hypothetical protein n=1 Tax=Zobellella denitrificans TaxID=347534 RepID=UPI0012FE4DE4|nr:hypothetical protein [Zobellella denitrificans]